MTPSRLLRRVERLGKKATDLAKELKEVYRQLSNQSIAVIRDKRPNSSASAFIGFRRLMTWLQTTSTKDGQSLESKLEGGSLEALVLKQELFYRERYGQGFYIDRRKIRLETSRLPAIAKGLETGAVNYPLIVATPETLNSAEQKQTEAEFAYRRLLEPLKDQGLKIWAATGTDRWTGLTLDEVLRGYIPVELSDFDLSKLIADWQKEFQMVIANKGQAPRVQAKQVRLVFTDSRQDIPKNQKPINQPGREVENNRSFIEMIKAQVKVLTPGEWITLAAQSYAKDKSYLSRNTWGWLMAVLDHQGKTKDANNSPVSAAVAYSVGGGVYLDSGWADFDGVNRRWRCSL